MCRGINEHWEIKKSGLFDAFYYLKENGDIRRADIDPLKHFGEFGWREERNPSKLFNTKFYLDQNPDVRSARVNPLYHFIKYGFREGRKPNPDIEAYFYWCLFTSRRKGIKLFIRKCKDAITIHKSGLFDKTYYLSQNKDLQESFTKSIFWKWRYSKNPVLRYLGRAKTSTVIHYVFHGVFEGKNPNTDFSNAYYINNNPDLRKEKYINPLAHYILWGKKEARTINAACGGETSNDLMQYTLRLIQDYGDELLNETVSVITESGSDPDELEERLQCILKQSHAQIEIILLLTQKDLPILQLVTKYENSYPQKIKTLTIETQEELSGAMWSRGISHANSEFIWLLPRASTCDNTFIDRSIVFFANESVMATFCPTKVGKSEQFQQPEQSQSSVGKSYIKTAFELVEEAEIFDRDLKFERGACLFRNIFSSTDFPKKVPALANDTDFRDFILDLIQEGAVAFTEETTHRRKADENQQTTEQYWNFEWLCHHQKMMSALRTDYQITPEKIKTNYESIRTDILVNSKGFLDDFLKIYDISKIIQNKPHLNIMISIVAFSYGGGEIMPIRLANQLKEMGYAVIVHSFRLSESELRVRKMLDPSIPVVTTQSADEMALILRKYHIDVVHTHHQAIQSFFAQIFNANVELHKRILHVGTSHGMYENFPDKTLQMIFERMGNGVDQWTYVADKNIIPFQNHGIFDEKRFTKIPNGMKVPTTHSVKREELGIGESSFTACIASRAIPEKGWLQAIEAVKMARTMTGQDIHLLLIGDGAIYQALLAEGTPDYIHLLGFCSTPCDYYAISDVCLIPSYYKSESAPLSLIEALLCHIPVISSNVGDVRKMLSINGELAGQIFDLDNWTIPVDILASKIAAFVTDKELYNHCKALAEEKSKEFDIVNVATKYLQLYEKKCKNKQKRINKTTLEQIFSDNRMLSNAAQMRNSLKVSVIVPNYNHEKYLRQRLDSIYNQTYKNIEVILMDDCSSDHSREILQEYAEKYKDITRLIFNEKNSGGVYHQWAKGIRNASSEVCWIAESDDYCEVNFLEKVLPAFSNPQVKLSYCQYDFVNTEGNENPGAFLRYVGTVDDNKWKSSYVNDASEEVETALAIKNTIPNVSGAVFRKPLYSFLLNDKNWLSMRICGDWIFYLHIIQNGKIAYTTKTKSYFRFHTSNTSVATYSTAAYYKEHEMVACAIKRLYDVSDQAILKNYENIHKFFDRNVHDEKLVFEELYNIQKVLSVERTFIIEQELDYVKNEINSINSELNNGSFKTVLVNPIISAGKNLNSSLGEKVKYTGNNTGNILFVEGMKEQLNFSREVWVRPSDLKGLDGNVSMVMPSSNFIIHGGDDFINLCVNFLEKTTFPFTMAGLGAQLTKELDTPKKLVDRLSPNKKKFFKMASERAVSLGIRGEFTAQCLEEMGIHNYRIIGCPSFYKYLDGKFPKLNDPTTKKVLMSVTTGSKMETRLLELGMSANAKWIMQMMNELPEMAFEGKLEEDSVIQKKFPGILLTPEEVQSYMRSHAAIFFRIADWDTFIREENFTFAFGSRFHGNMCALRNGVPALWIVHDSRTQELVNTLSLPHIDFAQLEKIEHVEDLLEFCDYDHFYQNYTLLCIQYVKFLQENHISNKFQLV